MKIQSISNLSFQKTNLKPKKVQKTTKNLTPMQEIHRDFTRATIIAIIIEAIMCATAYFKIKASKETEPQKVEQFIPDANSIESITLWNE